MAVADDLKLKRGVWERTLSWQLSLNRAGGRDGVSIQEISHQHHHSDQASFLLRFHHNNSIFKTINLKETDPGQQTAGCKPIGVCGPPWGHHRRAVGFIAHKGWEHRPAERMCQQIIFFFGLSTTTSQPGGPYNGGASCPNFTLKWVTSYVVADWRIGW